MTQGSRDPPGRIPRTPRLQPGQLALFQISDNPVSHLAVNIAIHFSFPFDRVAHATDLPLWRREGEPVETKNVRGGAGAGLSPSHGPGAFAQRVSSLDG